MALGEVSGKCTCSGENVGVRLPYWVKGRGSGLWLRSDSLERLKPLMAGAAQRQYGLSMGVLGQDTWVHILALSLPGCGTFMKTLYFFFFF